MDLPRGGVDEERGGRLLTAKNILDARQVGGQLLRRDGHVLDDGQRLGRPAQHIQSGQRHLTHLPEAIALGLVTADARENG